MREAIPANSEATRRGLSGQGADICPRRVKGGGGRTRETVGRGVGSKREEEQEGKKDEMQSEEGGGLKGNNLSFIRQANSREKIEIMIMARCLTGISFWCRHHPRHWQKLQRP